MNRLLVAAVSLLTLPVGLALAQPGGGPQVAFKIVTVVEGLQNPWSMAWLPNGDMLVTERGAGDYPGSLRIIRGGKLLPTPVPGVPAVRAQGQGGMQEIAVHPNFAQNHFVYLSYAKPRNDGMEGTTALMRAKLEGDKLVEAKEIFEAKAWSNSPGHFGARIAFGKRLSEHSVWEQRVAEARIEIDCTRLLCLKAADMMDKAGNKAAKAEIAMIKVKAPRMALKVIDDAIQAHGGAGVSQDTQLAGSWAGIRTLRLADGPDEVHNRSIALIEYAKHAEALG